MKHHQGQALVESLVIFLVLISLFVAIPWLGRLLDIRQQQDNASRYGAFQLTRQLDGIDEASIKDKFFLGDSHRWQDRQGKRMVTQDSVNLNIDTSRQLSDEAQAAQQIGSARSLREQWQIQDKGIADVLVDVVPSYAAKGSTWAALGVDSAFLERLVIPMQRHTAILTDAGHSASDKEAHQRTGQSALAWQDSAEASYELGRHIQHYAAPVEGFNRAQPVFDWLMPWTGRLPKHHLHRDKPKGE
ncbi:MAG: TadE family protein [Pelistega sp.]|nr:TadE family protein [Pelistega sp.]